jgi:hypothetical protein
MDNLDHEYENKSFIIEFEATADEESQKVSIEQLKFFLNTVENNFVDLYQNTKERPYNTKFHERVKDVVEEYWRWENNPWDGEWNRLHKKTFGLPDCLKILQILNEIEDVPKHVESDFYKLKNYITSYLLDETRGSIQVKNAIETARKYITVLKNAEHEVQNNLENNVKSMATANEWHVAKVTQGHANLQRKVDTILGKCGGLLQYADYWYPVTLSIWKMNRRLQIEIADTKAECERKISDVQNESNYFQKYEAEKAEVLRLKKENRELTLELTEAKKKWYHNISDRLHRKKNLDMHELLADLNAFIES